MFVDGFERTGDQHTLDDEFVVALEVCYGVWCLFERVRAKGEPRSGPLLDAINPCFLDGVAASVHSVRVVYSFQVRVLTLHESFLPGKFGLGFH